MSNKDDFTELRDLKMPSQDNCDCSTWRNPASVTVSGLINEHAIGNGVYVKLEDVIATISESFESDEVFVENVIDVLKEKFDSASARRATMTISDARPRVDDNGR